METADILEKAAEVLEIRGWTQNTYEDAEGQVCAVGAIRVVAWGHSRWSGTGAIDYQVAGMAQAAMSAHLGVRDLAIEWNDSPERTKEEVIDAFKHAAKDLRNNA